MVKIRLRRVGAKKQPSYRLVVADSRSPRDGRFIESIGHYNPRTDPPTVVVREDRALYWLSVGAQPSEAVSRFFKELGLRDKLKQVQGGSSIEDVTKSLVQVSGPEDVKPSKPEAKKPAKEEKKEETKAKKPAEEAEAPAEAEEAPEAAEEPEVEAEPEPEVEEETPEAEAEEEEAPAEAESVAAAVEAAPESGEIEAEAPEAAQDMAKKEPTPISALELSTRVENVLTSAGINTVADLQAVADEGDDALLKISGIGGKAVEEIQEKLEAYE